MKDEIFEEIRDWYKKKNKKPDENFEEFIDFIYNKTADTIFEKIREELREEFEEGTLKHPFIISGDYYLYLKLKDIKQKIDSSMDQEIKTKKIE